EVRVGKHRRRGDGDIVHEVDVLTVVGQRTDERVFVKNARNVHLTAGVGVPPVLRVALHIDVISTVGGHELVQAAGGLGAPTDVAGRDGWAVGDTVGGGDRVHAVVASEHEQITGRDREGTREHHAAVGGGVLGVSCEERFQLGPDPLVALDVFREVGG